MSTHVRSALLLAVSLCALPALTQTAAAGSFKVEEATIDQIHHAIQSGETTCTQVVESYLARAKAYNGMCTQLVTADGKKIKPGLGTVRAGAPVKFPSETVSINKLFPDFDQYSGLPPDLGRMEATKSDPSVQQQYGMVVGIPEVHQVNALDTINLRGERSVTCKGDYDAAPGKPLPAGAPAACEKFRQQPDALETAAALDKKYGKNPDLKAMPLYCVPMSFKAVYDAKDLRSTGGGDVAYATDFAPEDGTMVRRLRESGAIIYAHAHNSEYNGGSGDPGGAAKLKKPMLGAIGARETWGGLTCNPYDTTRETGGSSGGSGASVAANLVTCSICETTGGSCRNPANYNGVVNFVPTKGMISYGGGIGANPYQDRPGILCKAVKDTAIVMDAFRDRSTGSYFDERDPYTALSHMNPASKLASFTDALSDPANPKPLAGLRIGIPREFYVKLELADGPVSDGVNGQLKVLKELGAELVETVDPLYPDDPSIPNMAFTFQDALAEVIPFHMPEVLSWKKDGKPEFEVPGWDVTSREYLVAASLHKAPWPANLNMRRIFGNPPDDGTPSGYSFSFNFAQYLLARGDDRIKDWKSLNENAKYYSNVRETAMDNWEHKAIDPATYDTTFTMKRRDTVRMAVMKVMEQNKIDVFVNPSALSIAAKFGGAAEEGQRSWGYGARLGIPEAFVPAGFVDAIYEPTFELSADKKKYKPVSAKVPTQLKHPLPFNIGFWGAPGDEAKVLKVASAYEAATHHRKAPDGFGPVK